MFADSPAEKAGIQTDDIILAIDGVATNAADFSREVDAFTTPGATISFKIDRKGERRDVVLVLRRMI